MQLRAAGHDTEMTVPPRPLFRADRPGTRSAVPHRPLRSLATDPPLAAPQLPADEHDIGAYAEAEPRPRIAAATPQAPFFWVTTHACQWPSRTPGAGFSAMYPNALQLPADGHDTATAGA